MKELIKLVVDEAMKNQVWDKISKYQAEGYSDEEIMAAFEKNMEKIAMNTAKLIAVGFEAAKTV